MKRHCIHCGLAVERAGGGLDRWRDASGVSACRSRELTPDGPMGHAPAYPLGAGFAVFAGGATMLVLAVLSWHLAAMVPIGPECQAILCVIFTIWATLAGLYVGLALDLRLRREKLA